MILLLQSVVQNLVAVALVLLVIFANLCLVISIAYVVVYVLDRLERWQKSRARRRSLEKN